MIVESAASMTSGYPVKNFFLGNVFFVENELEDEMFFGKNTSQKERHKGVSKEKCVKVVAKGAFQWC